MTYKPLLFSALFLFLVLISKAQDKPLSERKFDCSGKPFSETDSISLSGTTFKYFLFNTYRGLEKGDSTSFRGEGSVLLKTLSNLDATTRKMLAMHILNKYKLQRVMFFENCELVPLYYRAMKLSEQEEQLIKKGTASYYWKDTRNP